MIILRNKMEKERKKEAYLRVWLDAGMAAGVLMPADTCC